MRRTRPLLATACAALRLIAIPEDGPPRDVALDLPGFFTGSEAGPMGLAVEGEGGLLAYYATEAGGSPQDVRVVRVVLAEDHSSAAVEQVLVEGMPTTSGRHSGPEDACAHSDWPTTGPCG